MLIHSPAQNLYHQSCFPAIFLHHWDFHFFDTCAAGSAFYLQKFLQLLSSQHQPQSKQDNGLCDLNILFEDCLWDFCSRIQISAHNLPVDMFTNRFVYEFYRRETNTMRRVKCLRQILQQSSELQTFLVDIYHQHLLTTKNSSEKINDFIYQVSKDILCGKRFDGLVESILTQTRNSFINFISNIFKIIVNDYGLDSLVQLAKNQQNYGALFNLIDLQSFAVENENDIFTSQTTKGTIPLIINYSCIPQTPLFHLFHQRVKSHANAIKTDLLTFERFRLELINSIRNDKTLAHSLNSTLVHVYSTDLVRTFCAVIDNNFDRNSVEFISDWLSYDCPTSEDEQSLWLLAHVYTTFEYEQTDIISMYVACRIFNQKQSILNQSIHDRSDLRETFFRSIFDELWTNLNQSFSDKDNYQKWVHTYVFISKYYPSNKVLKGIQLSEIRCQIDLMNLAHRILLNEKLFEPHALVANILNGLRLNTRSNCLTLLPKLIEIIYQYIQEKQLVDFTLMIDMQQWILSIFKSYTQPSEQVISSLLTYLNQITIHVSLAMKQFLFDQLVDLILQMKQSGKSRIDLWDRFSLLPILTKCISNVDNLEYYQIPFHPSVVNTQKHENIEVPLFDLYFVHLRAQLKYESITPKFLNKGMLLKVSPPESIFKQLRDYFLSIIMGQLLCRMDLNQDDEKHVLDMFSTMTQDLLAVHSTSLHLNKYLQVFLSIILSKYSWQYLFEFLQSRKIRATNENWAQALDRLLQWNESAIQNAQLRLAHQIQFSFSSNSNHSSIFPSLHHPYEELRKIISNFIQDNSEEILTAWIFNQITSRYASVSNNQLKAMLFLHIYYDYYCTNQLELIQSSFDNIEMLLSLSEEELRIFRVILDPEQYMVGYCDSNNTNSLNELFKMSNQNEFDRSIRHMLVNLMAMILLGGQNSFLWTFAFQPLSLKNTFGKC